MKLRVLLGMAALIFCGCNDGKVYQGYIDFKDRSWLVSDTARFDFTIPDTASRYNVFCNIRNSTFYPYSRIFMNFTLADSIGRQIHKSMLNDFLFDPKSGKPMGKSGLGDLYDHQLVVLKNFKFQGSGPFRVKVEQLMRTDTLAGILSVGLGIEKAQ